MCVMLWEEVSSQSVVPVECSVSLDRRSVGRRMSPKMNLVL